MGFGSIVGGVIGAISGHQANKTNQAIADANNQTSIELANTAVSRRVADLERNGMNKLLAVQNASSGAAVPTLQQGKVENYSGQNMANMINMYSAMAQAKKTEAETVAINQENGRSELRTQALELENRLMSEGILTEGVKRKLINAQSDESRSNILVNAYKAQGIKIDNDIAKQELAILGIEQKIKEAEKPIIEEESKAWKNKSWGMNLKSVYGGILDALKVGSMYVPFTSHTVETGVDSRGRYYERNVSKRERRGF
nr:MAG: DNA pilot protein [Microvirus Sku119]